MLYVIGLLIVAFVVTAFGSMLDSAPAWIPLALLGLALLAIFADFILTSRDRREKRRSAIDELKIEIFDTLVEANINPRYVPPKIWELQTMIRDRRCDADDNARNPAFYVPPMRLLRPAISELEAEKRLWLKKEGYAEHERIMLMPA